MGSTKIDMFWDREDREEANSKSKRLLNPESNGEVTFDRNDSLEGRLSGAGPGLSDSFARVAGAWREQKRPNWLHWSESTEELENRRAPWRKELGEALEATPAHVVIVLLLLIDLLATVVDILKTVHNKTHDLSTCTAYLQKCHCTDPFERTKSWEFLYWISISILSVLAVNVLALMVAFGTAFFRHPGYVLDLVVVYTALALEIFLDTDTVGILIVLTLWRIVRVAHGIFEVTDEAWEKEVQGFEQKLKNADREKREDEGLLRQKDDEIAELRNRLRYSDDDHEMRPQF